MSKPKKNPSYHRVGPWLKGIVKELSSGPPQGRGREKFINEARRIFWHDGTWEAGRAANRSFMVYILVGSKYSALSSVRKVNYPKGKKRRVEKAIVKVASLISQNASWQKLHDAARGTLMIASSIMPTRSQSVPGIAAEAAYKAAGAAITDDSSPGNRDAKDATRSAIVAAVWAAGDTDNDYGDADYAASVYADYAAGLLKIMKKEAERERAKRKSNPAKRKATKKRSARSRKMNPISERDLNSIWAEMAPFLKSNFHRAVRRSARDAILKESSPADRKARLAKLRKATFWYDPFVIWQYRSILETLAMDSSLMGDDEILLDEYFQERAERFVDSEVKTAAFRSSMKKGQDDAREIVKEQLASVEDRRSRFRNPKKKVAKKKATKKKAAKSNPNGNTVTAIVFKVGEKPKKVKSVWSATEIAATVGGTKREFVPVGDDGYMVFAKKPDYQGKRNDEATTTAGKKGHRPEIFGTAVLVPLSHRDEAFNASIGRLSRYGEIRESNPKKKATKKKATKKKATKKKAAKKKVAKKKATKRKATRNPDSEIIRAIAKWYEKKGYMTPEIKTALARAGNPKLLLSRLYVNLVSEDTHLHWKYFEPRHDNFGEFEKKAGVKRKDLQKAMELGFRYNNKLLDVGASAKSDKFYESLSKNYMDMYNVAAGDDDLFDFKIVLVPLVNSNEMLSFTWRDINKPSGIPGTLDGILQHVVQGRYAPGGGRGGRDVIHKRDFQKAILRATHKSAADKGRTLPHTRRNPTKKKAARKKTPPYQLLINRCQKLWDHYCERPSKSRLKPVLEHLEKMKASTSKKVADERKRCLRVANKEARRLKMK